MTRRVDDRDVLSPYATFELALLFAAGCCGVHARRTSDLPFFATAVVYGVVLEKLVVVGFDRYAYPAARLVDVAGIPAAVGLGWSVVLYAGYDLARRWDVSPPSRAAFVALFGLHVDLAMDAVAIRFQPVGLWSWTPPGPYFGVPLGNFFGWFAVGFLFVATYDVVLRVGDRRWGVDALRTRGVAALGSLVVASVLLYSSLEVWDAVTVDAVWRKVVVLGACVVAAAAAVARSSPTLRRPGVLPSVGVFAMHAYFMIVLFWLGLHRTRPFLLAASLAMLAVAVALHAAPAVFGREPKSDVERA